MPYKLIGYLIRHALVGLALSTTAVLGFAYFIMVPGGGAFLDNLTEATEQLMQISHLLMPLVVLIGLSFGLGLLHNHSEIVQLSQLQSVRVSLIAVVATFMLFTVISERLLWPLLEADNLSSGENSEWHKSEDTYIDQQNQAIRTANGRIIGFANNRLQIGEAPNADWKTQTFQRREESVSWLMPPNTVKAQYAWWKQWHQALWPTPLFVLLWVLLSKRTRGGSAAGITGALAGTAIASGLFAEATHIVLNKALVTPLWTMLAPWLLVALASYNVARRRH